MRLLMLGDAVTSNGARKTGHGRQPSSAGSEGLQPAPFHISAIEMHLFLSNSPCASIVTRLASGVKKRPEAEGVWREEETAVWEMEAGGAGPQNIEEH